MNIHLDVEKANGYLHVHPRGIYAREDVFPVSRQVLDECRQHDCDRILLDASDLDMDTLSSSETRFVVQHIAKTFSDSHGITIAFVVTAGMHRDFSAALADIDRHEIMIYKEQSAAIEGLLK